MREYLGVQANQRLPINLALTFLMAAGLIACDSSARSTKPSASAQRAEGESLVYESCATSSQCAGELRCIDGSCQAKERSRLGDLYAAAGRRAAAAGDTDKASKSYNAAVTQYDNEKLAPPIDLLCEQGAAMAEGRDDKQLAEAAARLLHKCVLVAPANSQLARHAFNALASLSEAGLDEAVIGRSETGDLYMSGESMKPDLSGLKLTVAPQGKKNRKRGFATLITELEGAASKQAFAACWEGYWKKTKSDALSVEIPFEYRFFLDEDDASGDRKTLKVGTRTAPVDSNLASASQCVEDAARLAAADAVKEMRDESRWDTAILIQIAK